MRIRISKGLGSGSLAAIGALALLVGCSGPGGGVQTAAMPPAAGVDESGQTRAPDFELEAVDGRKIRLSDSAGKVRLLDFWATWCAPCREEIPMLNELQASYGDQGFQILAISDEDQEVIADFVEEYGVQYTNLVGTEELSELYGVLGLPAAYLVDREGKIVDTFLGPKPRRVLVKKIEALLEASPAT